MADAAASQLTVAIWSLGLILGTLVFTAVAALATRQTVHVMRETSKQDVRAYVGIQEMSLECESNDSPDYQPDPIVVGGIAKNKIKVALKNFGRTPASNVHIWVNWQPLIWGYRLPDDFTYPDQNNVTAGNLRPSWSNSVVFPDQVFQTWVTITDMRPFFSAQRRDTVLYLYGHVEYIDIHKTAQHTLFCYSYCPWRPVGDQFIPYEKHNKAT
jgi:hypothetical protein